jgi:hypothetical protein
VTSSSRPPKSDTPLRLVDVLKALPSGELDSLIQRLGIRIDPAKRLDTPAQVARALVALPELRDTSILQPSSAELLHRIAESRGLLITPAVPPGVEPLAARGLVFARLRGPGKVELILPPAYLVQLRTWEGEDPRGIRALLAQASFETCSAIASHYLGRPATPPLPLALEAAWEIIGDPDRIEEELERLSPQERRLLEAIEREGGEVVTEELLDLEREPMRLRTATGATPSRRGAGFALERRGFLIPVHPNRHVIPTEVGEIVGKATRAEHQASREKVRASVLAGDYLPRRARFAEDPVPLALAMAISVRENVSEIRTSVGTPRAYTTRMAQRYGRDVQHVSLIAALSRAAGLWEAASLSASSPPGAWSLGTLSKTLFKLWRRGGAWDEARALPELYRLPPDSRDPSPVGLLRELLLDALQELSEVHWVPWQALATYVRDDPRTAGVARLLRRWGERQNIEAPSPVDVVQRMTFESLPALGVLDLGDPDAPLEGDEVSPAVRLTSRGRMLLGSKKAQAEPATSRFSSPEVLTVGPTATVSAVLSLAAFVEVGRVADELDLLVSASTLTRALSAGIEAEVLRTRLEALAPLPDELARILTQASAVLARARFTPAAGYLWIDDENVREMLLSRRPTADLFLDPSPQGGLLLAPGADLDRLIRRCRALGVELTQEGRVLRARSTTPAPEGATSSSAERRRSSTPPPKSSR